MWIIFFLFWITNCQHNHCSSPSQTTKQLSLRESGTGSPGGIPNLKATCYMNSVLQILKAFYLPKVNEKSDELAKPLQALMQVIQDDREAANQNEAIAVFEALHHKFGWTSDYESHEDAADLMDKFLDWINIPLAATNTISIDPTTKEAGAPSDDQWFNYHVELPTEREDLKTIQDFFNNSLVPDKVMAKLKEDKSDRALDRVKRLKDLDKLYKGMLILQLKRFATNGGTTRLDDRTYSKDFVKIKIDKEVEEPFHLIIKKEQTFENEKNFYYKLVGFIRHKGSLEEGHYKAYIKKDGIWICYNDNDLSTVSDVKAEAKAKQAYLFFYEPIQLKRNP